MRIADSQQSPYFRCSDGAPVLPTEALAGVVLRNGYGMRFGPHGRAPAIKIPDAAFVAPARPVGTILMHDQTTRTGDRPMQLADALDTHLPGANTRTRQAFAALNAQSSTALESGLTFARDHLRQMKDSAEAAKPGQYNDAAVSCVVDHLQARIDAATDRFNAMRK